MIDQLVIIKSQLKELTDSLVNYEGTEEELSHIREALNYLVAASHNLASAKAILSNLKSE